MSSFNTTIGSNDDGNDEYQIPYYDELVELQAFMKNLYISEDAFLDVIYKIIKDDYPLTMVTTAFGTASNLINLVVFHRQGLLADSYTVTIAALAVSDFFVCFMTLLKAVITWIIVVADTSPSDSWLFVFDGHLVKPGPTSYLIALMIALREPTYIMLEFNAWVTAFMTFERMVSVTFPFQVKSLFNTKRACIAIIFFLLMATGLYLPGVLRYKLTWIQYTNETAILDIALSGLVSPKTGNAFVVANNTGFRSFYIAVIFACNLIIVIKVNSSQRFRKSRQTPTPTSQSHSVPVAADTNNTSKTQSENGQKASTKTAIMDARTRKEIRLIRTMYLLSITFLISRAPVTIGIAIGTFQLAISDYWANYGYTYNQYFFYTMDEMGRYLVVLNGATNILIYYTLGKKYRTTLREIMSCRQKSSNNN